jgi:hypothetical protein
VDQRLCLFGVGGVGAELRELCAEAGMSGDMDVVGHV